MTTVASSPVPGQAPPASETVPLLFHGLDPLILAMIAAVTGALLILFLSFALIRTMRAKKRLTATTGTLETILAAGPDGYVLARDDGSSKCSRRLAVLLGLPNGTRSTMADVLARFMPEDAAMLEKAMGETRKTEQSFRIIVRESAGNRRIKTFGLPIDPGPDGRPGVLVWMRDVTEEEIRRDALQERALSLLEERNRLRATIDTLPLPLWIRDRDLALTDCNETFARALDLADPRSACHSGRELLDGAGAADLRTLAARSQAEGRPVRGRFHVVLNGDRRLLDITETPLLPAGTGTASVGHAVDVTAIEDMESRLENETNANAEILERLTSGIALYGPDTHLRFFNRSYARLWGLDPAWLATLPAYGDVLEHLREARRLPEVADFPAYKTTELAFFTKLMRPREDILHLPDGATLSRVIAAHPLGGLIVTTEDVTDSLAQERAHTQLSAVFDETVANLQEATAIFDGSGRLRRASPAFGALLQPPPGGLDTRSFLETMQRNIRSGADAEALRTHLNARVGDASVMLRNGRIVAYRIAPLSDGGWIITLR